ncbi:MAG: hypothetical protein DME53_05585 [Verrucomicrobia bacterium]|nr:MAG: hypothetical protein DME53_05585 [Verrucomicrobiota bacterium]
MRCSAAALWIQKCHGFSHWQEPKLRPTNSEINIKSETPRDRFAKGNLFLALTFRSRAMT